jgi:hypothetical protein
VGEELLASLFSSCAREEVSVTIHAAGSDGRSEFSELSTGSVLCHVYSSKVSSCDSCRFFLATTTKLSQRTGLPRHNWL